ncbi:hypothetical protein ES288_A01G001800v1 [Gossypium darwinii]|uniref:Uncharacterized protein n=2 Tax=Gossypium TaxID=3633 RepID=A0A5D2RK33_GOSTO|nr:hypothetical protein ES288_A01G001800v1 [Gossypium darwinii]TYI41169.1 hypothetical protein ES332_A01G001300v1 [Gossypium tomentosum]
MLLSSSGVRRSSKNSSPEAPNCFHHHYLLLHLFVRMWR